MTRVTCIPARYMLNEWLVAEHRETKRIPNDIVNDRARDFTFLESFRLNEGHMLFFRNRLGFIYRRQFELYTELRRRGMKATDFMVSPYKFKTSQLGLWRDWQPTEQDYLTCIERLQERFDARKRAYHYGNVVIDDEHTFNRYLNVLEKRVLNRL